jgi:outer membrane protein assembly factor BamB
MFKHIAYGGVVVTAAVTLSGLGGAGASATADRAGHTAGHAAATAGTAAAVPGTQLWVQRYNGPANGNDQAMSMAVSPGGGTVFVTGSRDAPNGLPNYATVAYNAATGAQRWVNSYNGPANRLDRAMSMAVSPNGGTVFVTGTSNGGASGPDYATVAYSAATGAQRWVQRYNGPANGFDQANAVAVSPSGGTVFVTGSRDAPNGLPNYATVAYNAATGAQRWVNSYNGPANRYDRAMSMAVSPGGGTVFVTGTSNGGASGPDYATVAYNAATGAQRWAKRYNGPGNRDDSACSVAVSPSGGTVFVTGTSYAAGEDDYATVAYNAATGTQRWATHRHTGGPSHPASSLAVSPTGGTVYVTGAGGTVAYNAATGAQLWAVSYLSSAGYIADFASVAVRPNGGIVYVTGNIIDTNDDRNYVTVAYNAATGAQMWVQRYDGPPNGPDYARSVAVSPGGDEVFVTGYSWGGTSGEDYATVAYSG